MKIEEDDSRRGICEDGNDIIYQDLHIVIYNYIGVDGFYYLTVLNNSIGKGKVGIDFETVI